MQIPYELTLEATRAKLRCWGRWQNTLLRLGLDYPSQSIIQQLIRLKEEAVKDDAATHLLSYEELETLDALINEFAKLEPNKAKILCIHYAEPGRVQNKLKKIQLSKVTYFRHLSDAENWVHERLD